MAEFTGHAAAPTNPTTRTGVAVRADGFGGDRQRRATSPSCCCSFAQRGSRPGGTRAIDRVDAARFRSGQASVTCGARARRASEPHQISDWISFGLAGLDRGGVGPLGLVGPSNACTVVAAVGWPVDCADLLIPAGPWRKIFGPHSIFCTCSV